MRYRLPEAISAPVLGVVELTVCAALRLRHADRPSHLGCSATRPIRTKIPDRAARSHPPPCARAAGCRASPGAPKANTTPFRRGAQLDPRSRPGLGMAVGRANLKGDDQAQRDLRPSATGAMSAGMAYEAMNNAGLDEVAALIVILNDNDHVDRAAGRRDERLSLAPPLVEILFGRCARSPRIWRSTSPKPARRRSRPGRGICPGAS